MPSVIGDWAGGVQSGSPLAIRDLHDISPSALRYGVYSHGTESGLCPFRVRYA